MNKEKEKGVYLGPGAKPIVIAGPCVIESFEMALELAEALSSLPGMESYQFIFKASYLKDNRSSADSYRGPGLKEGLEILQKVKEKVGCMVISDVHCREEIKAASEVLDVIQIPAFLCRQTRLIEAAAKTGKILNIKKGQFLAPEDVRLIIGKVKAAGGARVMVTERGTVFGYHDLVVDFRSFSRIKRFGCPVILDVTHSLQKPSSLGDRAGGEPGLAAMMARAAAAVPCDGLFVETHFDPGKALSDGASMIPFSDLGDLLEGAGLIFKLAQDYDWNAQAREKQY